MKDLDPEVIQRGLLAAGDSIVNPRCDECNTPISTPHPSQAGLPRLCSICTALVHRETRIRFRDYESQERPRGRKIHVVRMSQPIKPVWGPPKVTPK